MKYVVKRTLYGVFSPKNKLCWRHGCYRKNLTISMFCLELVMKKKERMPENGDVESLWPKYKQKGYYVTKGIETQEYETQPPAVRADLLPDSSPETLVKGEDLSKGKGDEG